MKPKLPPSRYLYFYQCGHCTTWAVTAGDGGSYVRCNGCGGSKKYKHRKLMTSDPVDEQTWEYATKYGVAHLPLPLMEAVPCHRCGQMSNKVRLRHTFWCCEDCYRAEFPPDVPVPPTPEQMKANAAERAELDRRLREHELFGQETAFTGNTGE